MSTTIWIFQRPFIIGLLNNTNGEHGSSRQRIPKRDSDTDF
jgi:hypothetical protein